MSKNIENTRIDKLPTSQLVLYMISPEFVDKDFKLQIEESLFNRLKNKYKLHPEMVNEFIKREQDIIEKRGYDLKDYSFGRDLPYEELFKIFYDNVHIYLEDENNETNLYNLTMSEIVEYWAWFLLYKNMFEKRQSYFYDFLRKMNNLKNELGGINVDDPEEDIKIIMKQCNAANIRMYKEKNLIVYNEMAKLFMFNEMKEIMGYSDSIRTYITMLKELYFIQQPSPIQKLEKKQYKDIKFDAYAHYTAPMKNINSHR